MFLLLRWVHSVAFARSWVNLDFSLEPILTLLTCHGIEIKLPTSGWTKPVLQKRALLACPWWILWPELPAFWWCQHFSDATGGAPQSRGPSRWVAMSSDLLSQGIHQLVTFQMSSEFDSQIFDIFKFWFKDFDHQSSFALTCQGHSRAGNRLALDDLRSGLLSEVFRLFDSASYLIPTCIRVKHISIPAWFQAKHTSMCRCPLHFFWYVSVLKQEHQKPIQEVHCAGERGQRACEGHGCCFGLHQEGLSATQLCVLSDVCVWSFCMRLIPWLKYAGCSQSQAWLALGHNQWPHVWCSCLNLMIWAARLSVFAFHPVVNEVWRERTFFLLCRQSFKFFKVLSECQNMSECVTNMLCQNLFFHLNQSFSPTTFELVTKVCRCALFNYFGVVFSDSLLSLGPIWNHWTINSHVAGLSLCGFQCRIEKMAPKGLELKCQAGLEIMAGVTKDEAGPRAPQSSGQHCDAPSGIYGHESDWPRWAWVGLREIFGHQHQFKIQVTLVFINGVTWWFKGLVISWGSKKWFARFSWSSQCIWNLVPQCGSSNIAQTCESWVILWLNRSFSLPWGASLVVPSCLKTWSWVMCWQYKGQISQHEKPEEIPIADSEALDQSMTCQQHVLIVIFKLRHRWTRNTCTFSERNLPQS